MGVPEKYRWCKCADDAAGQEDRGREQGRFRCQSRRYKVQPVKEEGDHGGRKHLEEAFHPQVNHPPAPVFHNRQMGVLAPGEARTVEQADGGRGHQENQKQMPLLAGLLQGRDDHSHDQRQPEQQADEESELPDSAQIDVLVTLMAEVERLCE